jgi:tetratricopeptide (TPR) repeat protein
MLRRLRATVEGFALVLQRDIEHDPAAHVWQVAPMQDAVRHWRGGEQDTALGHIAGVVGHIEARIGRLDVALQFLALYQETAERLLAANPESAQAARDVSVSLNKLGDFLSRRGQPGDATQALGHYQRDLEISERLLAANPESAQAARDVSVSHFKFFHIHRQRGDEQAAMASLAKCFAILDSFARAGRPMDAQMRQLHAQLAPMFGCGD